MLNDYIISIIGQYSISDDEQKYLIRYGNKNEIKKLNNLVKNLKDKNHIRVIKNIINKIKVKLGDSMDGWVSVEETGEFDGALSIDEIPKKGSLSTGE